MRPCCQLNWGLGREAEARSLRGDPGRGRRARPAHRRGTGVNHEGRGPATTAVALRVPQVGRGEAPMRGS